MTKKITLILIVSAILIGGVFLAGCTQDAEITTESTPVTQAAATQTLEKVKPAGTPPADMQGNSTFKSNTPPEDMATNMTRPSGTPPADMQGDGTRPSGTPPEGGMQPSGTPPSGTPPSGTPPSGTPPGEASSS
ncbi:MAG: hypothetical protein GYA23_12685 [Methanomicrobiales archaeon]|nr:hypothetical protein [Methanomicrobiales archaeon]